MPSISRVRALAVLLIACVATAIASVACSRDDSRTSATPRRAILIVIDTLRADHLGCYGYERDTSPNIDAFAEQSVLFEHAYAQAPWTVASVASILSSLYPQTHGLTHAKDNRALAESIELLPERLADDGLATAAFVANMTLDPTVGFYEGFDEHAIVVDENAAYPDEGTRINQRAIPFLERHADTSFFLYLQYMDPHDPYDDPAGHYRTFDPDYDGSFDGSIGPLFDAMARRRPWTLDDRELEHMIARYDGEIRYVDERVHEVFATLDRLGIADETVVVVTSDHGEQFFEHGGLKHGTSIYDEEVRVPLIVRAPGTSREGTRVPNPVALVDVYPTLVELLDAGEPPASLDGHSLVPLLRGDRVDRGDVFTETAHGWSWKDDRMQYNRIPMAAIVRDRHKLITIQRDEFRDLLPDAELDPSARPYADELYDIVEDPRERRNLAPGATDRVERLREPLRTWREETRARLKAGRTFSKDERTDIQERLKKLGYLHESDEDDDARETESDGSASDDPRDAPSTESSTPREESR